MSLPTFQSLQREMNRLFDESFGGVPEGGTRVWSPPVEIYETRDQLLIEAELPGFEKGDINLSFENGQLSLSGERKPAEAKDRSYHRNERWYGRFERVFQLPPMFDASQIRATLKNGVLVLTLPKREEAKSRKISIAVT